MARHGTALLGWVGRLLLLPQSLIQTEKEREIPTYVPLIVVCVPPPWRQNFLPPCCPYFKKSEVNKMWRRKETQSFGLFPHPTPQSVPARSSAFPSLLLAHH